MCNCCEREFFENPYFYVLNPQNIGLEHWESANFMGCVAFAAFAASAASAPS